MGRGGAVVPADPGGQGGHRSMVQVQWAAVRGVGAQPSESRLPNLKVGKCMIPCACTSVSGLCLAKPIRKASTLEAREYNCKCVYIHGSASQ